MQFHAGHVCVPDHIAGRIAEQFQVVNSDETLQQRDVWAVFRIKRKPVRKRLAKPRVVAFRVRKHSRVGLEQDVDGYDVWRRDGG
jgi:hypothetical protein